MEGELRMKTEEIKYLKHSMEEQKLNFNETLGMLVGGLMSTGRNDQIYVS